MTFAISIGKYGGFYWSRDYTTLLCLGWIAFTWYPFEFEGYHNKVADRTTSLMDCYIQAVSDAARLREELDAARAILRRNGYASKFE